MLIKLTLYTQIENVIPLPSKQSFKDRLPAQCGIRVVEDTPADLLQSPRIVKGQKTRPGAHPWMVGIISLYLFINFCDSGEQNIWLIFFTFSCVHIFAIN